MSSSRGLPRRRKRSSAVSSSFWTLAGVWAFSRARKAETSPGESPFLPVLSMSSSAVGLMTSGTSSGLQERSSRSATSSGPAGAEAPSEGVGSFVVKVAIVLVCKFCRGRSAIFAPLSGSAIFADRDSGRSILAARCPTIWYSDEDCSPSFLYRACLRMYPLASR